MMDWRLASADGCGIWNYGEFCTVKYNEHYLPQEPALEWEPWCMGPLSVLWHMPSVHSYVADIRLTCAYRSTHTPTDHTYPLLQLGNSELPMGLAVALAGVEAGGMEGSIATPTQMSCISLTKGLTAWVKKGSC